MRASQKVSSSSLIPQLDFNSGISWERRGGDRKSPSENMSHGQIFSHIFDGVLIFSRNTSFTSTQWVSWGWTQIVFLAIALGKSSAAAPLTPPSFCPAAIWSERTPPSLWLSKVTQPVAEVRVFSNCSFWFVIWCRKLATTLCLCMWLCLFSPSTSHSSLGELNSL